MATDLTEALSTRLPLLGKAAVSLPIAAGLGAALAFRPCRLGAPHRDLEVIHTQIILAIVGALVMLITGESLARAFGIVGAAGLDPPTARSICELAIKLRDIEGVTSMFVTHNLDDVRFLSSKYIVAAWGDELELRSEDERLCLINTKFMMLRGGRVIFDGTDEQLWASEDQYIRGFLMGERVTLVG